MEPSDITFIPMPSTDPRLGRNVYHDERSRASGTHTKNGRAAIG